MIVKTEVIREFDIRSMAEEELKNYLKNNIQHGVDYHIREMDIGEIDMDQLTDKGQDD